MRLGTAILALAAAVSLGGCSLKKQKTVAAAPAPPKPAAPAKPAEPLSIPQTSVELPPPQPVPPDSLPPADLGTPPVPPPPPPRTNSPRPPRTGSPPARTEPQLPAGPPAPATPPATETARPPMLEVLPAAESKRLQDEANGRIQETRQLIGKISARRLRQQDSLHKRIESFLTQAEDAERRGDMRQASELAGRALVLARELRP